MTTLGKCACVGKWTESSCKGACLRPHEYGEAHIRRPCTRIQWPLRPLAQAEEAGVRDMDVAGICVALSGLQQRV